MLSDKVGKYLRYQRSEEVAGLQDGRGMGAGIKSPAEKRQYTPFRLRYGVAKVNNR